MTTPEVPRYRRKLNDADTFTMYAAVETVLEVPELHNEFFTPEALNRTLHAIKGVMARQPGEHPFTLNEQLIALGCIAMIGLAGEKVALSSVQSIARISAVFNGAIEQHYGRN